MKRNEKTSKDKIMLLKIKRNAGRDRKIELNKRK